MLGSCVDVSGWHRIVRRRCHRRTEQFLLAHRPSIPADIPQPATPAFSRDGGQGYNVHRADFLNLLFAALPKGTLNLGHRCIQLKEDGDRVRFSFAHGAAADADVLIGADGIRSVVQREIGLQSRPTSEGIMAYRGLIPAERLAWANDLRDPALWLGSGRSFLLYPVANGRLINMVAF